MSNKAFDFDSGYGNRYDNLARLAIFGYEPLFLMALSLLDLSLGEEANILIGGSGTGMELATFGMQKPGWKFTGVDPSEQMIRLSQVKIENQGLEDRVRFHCGYVDDLPEDERYDAATLVLVMQFVPDNGEKLSLLQSISKRLKPGANLILVDLHGDPDSEYFQHMLGGWQHYMVNRGLAPEAVETLLKQAMETHHFVPETRIKELLAESGFHRVQRFYSAYLHGGWVAQRA